MNSTVKLKGINVSIRGYGGQMQESKKGEAALLTGYSALRAVDKYHMRETVKTISR